MKIEKGRPADEERRTEKEIRSYDLLDRLGIEYYRIDHEPAGYGVDETFFRKLEGALGTYICNNLFLANRQRTKFYMMMIPAYKKFRSSDISKQAGTSRLHFAEPEYMEEMIGCESGSASVMGLIYDTEHKVHIIVDDDILAQEYFGCHPCINTTSLRIKTKDIFEKLLPATGHDYTVVHAERPVAESFAGIQK